MAEEKGESLPKNLDDWLKNILEKSKSFQGTKDEKQANDEKVFFEVFDELIKQIKASPDIKKDIPAIPLEENQYILRGALFVYAQVYYKIIEVISSSSVAYADLHLNNDYLQVIKKIRYLLSLEEFKNFTGQFNPPEHILPSSGLGDIGWEDVVAPQVEGFLASAQAFLNELNFSDQDAVERTTFVLKWLHKQVEPIIKRTEEYRQKTERYFNGLIKNCRHEQTELQNTASASSNKPEKKSSNAGNSAKNNNAIKEQEEILEPKPPEFLQNLLWLWKHGVKYWKLILSAVLILLVLKIFVLPKFTLFSKEQQNTKAKTSGDSSPAVITSGTNGPVSIYISPAQSGTRSEIKEPNVDQAQQPSTRDISKQQSETEKKRGANQTKNEPIIKKRLLSIQPDETEGEVNLPKKGELKKRDSAIPPDENEGEVRKTK